MKKRPSITFDRYTGVAGGITTLPTTHEWGAEEDVPFNPSTTYYGYNRLIDSPITKTSQKRVS
jgi:hypothetical protein